MNRLHKVLTAAAAWLTTGALLLSVGTSPVSAASLRGDINADGLLNLTDAATLYKATSGVSALPSTTVADVDKSGNVNTKDAMALYAHISGTRMLSTVSAPSITPISHSKRYGRQKLVASGQLKMVDAYDYLHKQVTALKKTIDLSAYNLTIPQAQRVFRYYRDDHPEVFWMTLEYSYRYSGSTFCDATFDYGYTSSQIASYKNQLATATNELLKGITASVPAAERARIVHNRLIWRAKYDQTGRASQAHNLLGVLVNKTGVCEGYAMAYQYLLHQCGIQAGVVVGQSKCGSHMWNFVYLDGNWYHTDVTWDDPIIESGWGKYYTYTNFNTTTAQMRSNHTIQTEYSTKDASYATSYPIPNCTATAENYQLKVAKAVSSYNPSAMAPVLADAIENDKPAIFRTTGGYTASSLETALDNNMSAMIQRMNNYLSAADRVSAVEYVTKVNPTHNTLEVFFR